MNTTETARSAQTDEAQAADPPVVYSKPLCVQCDATKRALNKAGIAYDVVDVTEDAVALERIKAMGYVQAPVVVTFNDHWSGFRPDKIKSIARPAAA